MTTTDTERLVTVNGVRLCVQSFGDPAAPPVLLIGGAGCSMIFWEEEFCARLAAERFVIRYDQRDSGRSVSYPAGSPGYVFRDLVDDALGVLDEFGIRRAHIVGLSMGAGIAQVLAALHAERVETVTMIASSTSEPGLPGFEPRIQELFGNPPPEPDWTDRDATIEYLVAQERPFAGSLGYDEQAGREMAGRVYDRTADVAASVGNHFAIKPDPSDPEPDLSGIRVPTLVLHGTDDPLFPLPHGVALAEAIPGARLVTLDRVGHEFPRAAWEAALPVLLDHTEPSALSSFGRGRTP
ncbi:alpha/beta fold hydrolase [Amycolatopsis suaedae]|uniref:Alpha/beta hydrolase n=1 Tax=Amycolatopsis suaedae TaxID=2510978 RepID=A0A4Q7JFM3_9PSEU|nr:alpha/beta hydrolase [Amycolatopsis suaedae]RZQ66056.1 alpha/beta hydrolase [Amycolatopsis suaedae]